MPELSGEDLRRRRTVLLRLLTPLVADKRRVEVRQIAGGQSYTVALLPKGTSPAAVTSPDAVRVRSKAATVFLNFYEVWIPSSNSTAYFLERSYLHIHEQAHRTAQDSQLLCLHCDPAISNGTASYRLKRAPHLHVGGTNPNISRSHIGLCLNDDEFGGQTVDQLTATLRLAIDMISTEIFPFYAEALGGR